MSTLTHRPERLRSSPALRALVRETDIEASDLVLPVFLNTDKKGRKEISSMPGVFRWSVEESMAFFEKQHENGIRSAILFGVVPSPQKDGEGGAAFDPEGPVIQTIRRLRKNFGDDFNIFADACFCEYTDHGHCGVFKGGQGAPWLRDDDATTKLLKREAVAYAEAGANVIAPSGMLDGMVGTIRAALDEKGHSRVAVCSYAVKYASAFYGPFRDAADNAPQAGTDRKGYQMDPANRREALREAELDLAEGADLLLVKPAMNYLDIIRDVADQSLVPVGAYQVSGEYAMMKAAAQNGWLNEDQAFSESLIAIKRAGAKFILTYWAPRAAELIRAGAL